MFKKSFLVVTICIFTVFWIARVANAATIVAMGEPRFESATTTARAIESLGFKTEGGPYFQNQTFLKVMKGGSATVYMKTDAEGKEVKFLSMQLPISLNEEAKQALRILVRSVAYAKGAKSGDLVSVEALFLLKFWPEKILKNWGKNNQFDFGMYNIAVTMEKLNNGNVYFEIQ